MNDDETVAHKNQKRETIIKTGEQKTKYSKFPANKQIYLIHNKHETKTNKLK